MVAHNAPFDRRVLRQAFERASLEWPDPPVLCTAALARTLLPLQRERRLGALADALGIDVAVAHRALPDAETCARVLCALFPRLCANATTIGDAVAMLKPRRKSRPRPPRTRVARAPAAAALPSLDFGQLPRDPGVYLFRDGAGQTLYVGKSVSIRSRARAHFAPSSPSGEWTAHAEIVDYRCTQLRARRAGAREPPDQAAAPARQQPAGAPRRPALLHPLPAGHRVSDPRGGARAGRGPRGDDRPAARAGDWRLELVEQLDSLFGLRHCGRRLPRREHPSAYGQMGRCLSPCLGDLDPNLYRRRLDEALRLFVDGGDGRDRLTRARGASDARGRRRSSSSSARRGCGGGRGGCGRSSIGSAACSRPRTRGRGWCWRRIRSGRQSRCVLGGRRAAGRLGPGAGDGDELERRDRGGAGARRVGRAGRRDAPAARRGRRDADRRGVPGVASGHAAAGARPGSGGRGSRGVRS